MLACLKLKLVEHKLKQEFGKFNKYHRFCDERSATSAEAKLRIAEEVLAGPSVNSLEAWAHALYLERRGIRP